MLKLSCSCTDDDKDSQLDSDVLFDYYEVRRVEFQDYTRLSSFLVHAYKKNLFAIIRMTIQMYLPAYEVVGGVYIAHNDQSEFDVSRTRWTQEHCTTDTLWSRDVSQTSYVARSPNFILADVVGRVISVVIQNMLPTAGCTNVCMSRDSSDSCPWCRVKAAAPIWGLLRRYHYRLPMACGLTV